MRKRSESTPRRSVGRIAVAGALAVVTGGAVVAGGPVLAAPDRLAASDAAASSSAAAGSSAVAPGTYTVTGRGFGHGHGMSQYGARGAALRGLTARQITDFYYPGTALVANGNPLVRIRLSAVEGRPVAVAAQTGLVATDGAGTRWTLSTGTTSWRVSWTPGNNLFALQSLSNGTYVTARYVSGPVRLSAPSPLTVQFGQNKKSCKRLPTVTYAGTLRTLAVSGVQRSVADLSRENYLRGVIASESPSGWPAAALQAQTIAARSYMGYKITPSRWYDAWDTTADQCWDGAASYYATTDAAIRATAGLVRSYQGRPAFAQFSSSNGGYLSAGSVPYLVSKPDLYEQYGSNPYATWTRSISPASFGSMAGVAKVSTVRVTARDGRGAWGGRVLKLAVSGKTAAGAAITRTVTGDKVRSALGLRSTYFTVTPPVVLDPRVWRTAPAIWRRSNQYWFPRGAAAFMQGTATSTPLAIDANGDGRPEYATFDGSDGHWYVPGAAPFVWGMPGDLPVVGDYDADHRTDLGVFRPATGEWLMRGSDTQVWGIAGDNPVFGDYTGDGRADHAVYRPSTHTWYVRGSAAVVWGVAGDIPAPADYNGDGRIDLAVFRPSTGTWWVRGTAPVRWGVAGDIPVPADYNGDGRAELTVFRPTTGGWWAKGMPMLAWGLPGLGDVPIAPPR